MYFLFSSFSPSSAHASEPSTSTGASGSGMAGTSGAEPPGQGEGEAGPSGLGSPQGITASSGKTSTQSELPSQSGASSHCLPGDSGVQAVVTENSQTHSDLNDENSEIRRRRLERFSAAASQNSDNDKSD